MSSAHAYQVVHLTEYAYDAVVNQSHGRAHLLPRDEAGQRVLSRTVEIAPTADEVHDHVDFYGNRSTYFRLTSPHQALSVTSTSRVEVDRTAHPWEAMDVARVGDRRLLELENEGVDLLARELVLPSPMVPRTAGVAAYAAPVLPAGRPLGEALQDLLDQLDKDFTYTSGVTTVSTPLETLLEQRTGVCQDFAHLMICCLRSAGIAARYVSGYLQTMPPPGKPRLVGADASHAWVSALVPGLGWVDLDPTNHQLVDHRYIVVARGRDYSDVPPLKGVIFTKSEKSTLRVSVDVQPVTPVLF
ncbi:MAG: transglutaminase domain protein [Frankiales bacterium]|nr:transglutaminase domain protein [Frankiales bacterium]